MPNIVSVCMICNISSWTLCLGLIVLSRLANSVISNVKYMKKIAIKGILKDDMVIL